MLTAVAINVPPDLSPAVAQIAVNRCESAIGRRRCPLASDVDDSVAIHWYAVVRAEEGLPPRLQIDFRERSLSGPLLAQRTLFFSDRDALQSRWASAGLVIAALVTETEELEALSTPASAQVATEQPTAVPRRSIPFGFDAGFVTGPGLQNGGYRVGAFGRGWIGLSAAAPEALVVAGFRYAERPGDASLTWLTLSLGAGIRIGKRSDPVNAEMTSVLLLERVLATAFDPSSGRSDSGGVTRFGGSIGADVAATLWKDLRILIGADVSALTPPVNVEVKGVSVGREPGLRFALTAGLRLDL
jgi:hypothetical protein